MDKELYEKGLATRRDVLGREYVDNALANAGEFAQGFVQRVQRKVMNYSLD